MNREKKKLFNEMMAEEKRIAKEIREEWSQGERVEFVRKINESYRTIKG